jgi:hypothetical protein
MNAQYFSKYRNAWVDFHHPTTPGQIMEMKKYHYRIKVNGKEI